jgi:cell wall-associated NlpC family hydrolase
VARDSDAEDTPYVGPRPFERKAEDRARFFGRDREVREIVSLIVSHPLVLVYAQSGAGKTSLFNTAVWEELQRLHVELLPLARVGGARPDLAPEEIANLYVFSALQSIDPEADRRELARLSLTDYLRRSRGDEPRTRTLVFDQFEELFTSQLVYELRGDRWQEEQTAFFSQVTQALADDPTLRIVFVMRKEYLAEIERFTPRLPERLQTRFLLEPLDGDEALAAVEGPLEGTDRSFAAGVAAGLVDGLLAMRVGAGRDVRGRFVEPVQLQVVCRSLWDGLPADATTITEADVEAFGDVATVLGRFYDEAVHAAASAGRVREPHLRAKLEEDFITSIGTRGTVYVQDWKRLSKSLEELERRHVVHAEFRSGTQWYELTHDRLIDPIRTSNRRLRRRRAQRFAIGAGAAAVAAAAAAAIAVAGDGGGDSSRKVVFAPPPADATIQVRSQTAVVGRTSPITITVHAVGGTIGARGGTAIARIEDGPGGFFRARRSCHYPGRRATSSCTVRITSALPGTTVVSAASRIPVAGTVKQRATTGTAGNGAPANTAWVVVEAKPAISIDPADQEIPWGGRAAFTITITNAGKAPLRDATVTSRLSPGCDRNLRAVAPGATIAYHCSGQRTVASYTTVATISSADRGRWTASATVFLDVRKGIVDAALAAVRQRHIVYSPDAKRMQGVREKIRLPNTPTYEDVSSFVTWAYWHAGAPDPMGNGYDGTGNTKDLIARGTRTTNPAPGDLVFYGPSLQQPSAVGIYVGNGRVVINTNEPGTPMNRPIRFRSDFPFLQYRSYDSTRDGRFVTCTATSCASVTG